jgi:hypothetical protein
MLMAMFANAHRLAQCQRVTRARIFIGGRHDPDIIAELAGNPFKNSQAGSIDAIVIGQKNTHQIIRSVRVDEASSALLRR